MDATVVNWIWLVAGVLLLGSELVAPTLVALFLGTAALMVAGLRFTGLVEGHGASLVLWALGSLVSIALLRRMLQRWASSERTRASTNEDARAFGTIVEVVVTVTATGHEGRVRFDGTSWPAVARRGTIPAGSRARLIHRDNLAWVIEPAEFVVETGAAPSEPARRTGG